MSKGKFQVGMTSEWMIVLIEFLASLRGVSDVTHDSSSLVRQSEFHLVGRLGAFVDGQLIVLHIGDATCVVASDL
jgi:hypothetical protein